VPIRPEFREYYKPPQWPEVRKRILARAKDRCEQCGKPNRKMVQTFSDRNPATGAPLMFWAPLDSTAWRDHNRRLWPHLRIIRGAQPHTIRVVLTIAHLNHTPGDDRDDNLKALCQWCHLNYDQLHHKETRMERKDRSRPLLVTRS
jgi:hypothetical protein